MHCKCRYMKVLTEMQFGVSFFLLVVMLCADGVRTDTDPMPPEVLQPHHGSFADVKMAEESRSKRSLGDDLTDACTAINWQALQKCPAFNEVLVSMFQESERKKRACIARLGEHAYYDRDLRTCGSCEDKNCLENYICKKECEVSLLLQDHAGTLRNVSWTQTALHNRVEIAEKQINKNKETQDEVGRNVAELTDRTAVVEDALDSQAKSETEIREKLAEIWTKIDSQALEIKLLRRENEDLFLWCGISTTIAVIATVVAIASFALHYKRLKKNDEKEKGQSAESTPLTSTSDIPAASNRSESSEQTTVEVANERPAVEARAFNAPSPPHLNVALSYQQQNNQQHAYA